MKSLVKTIVIILSFLMSIVFSQAGEYKYIHSLHIWDTMNPKAENCIAVSPDGQYVYITGYWHDSIKVFKQNTATGELEFIEEIVNGQNGVLGLDGVWAVEISNDQYGQNVYAVSSFDRAVSAFSRDKDTGKLKFIGMLGGFTFSLRSLAISPDGRNGYIISSTGHFVAVASRNRESGELLFVDIDAPYPTMNGVNAVKVSGDGNYVFFTTIGEQSVLMYDRDKSTGKLAFKSRMRGMNGACSVTEYGPFVYVAAELDNTVTAYLSGPNGFSFGFKQVVRDDSNGINQLKDPISIRTMGKNIFVSAKGDNAISIFEVDMSGSLLIGTLSLVEVIANGVDGVQDLEEPIAIEHANFTGYLYALAADGDLVVFKRGGITPVNSEAESIMVNKYILSQNYPNPFNPATTIRFALPQASFVTLKIYDLLGREIATLVEEYRVAGEHKIAWKPVDLPGGVYLYRLQAGEFVETRKLILQK